MTISGKDNKSKQTQVVLEASKRIQTIMDKLKDKTKKDPPFMTERGR